MSKELLDSYRKNEADNIALSVQLNHWSLVMIRLMIREQEKKLIAINLPVDGGNKAERWWEGIA